MRLRFATQTGNGDCGGTDADVYLVLEGNRGRSPESGWVWDLNNNGDDRERGDIDVYNLNTNKPHGGGNIGWVHTIHIYFSYTGNAPAWDLDWATLTDWDWNDINSWRTCYCLDRQDWFRWTNHAAASARGRLPNEFLVTHSWQNNIVIPKHRIPLNSLTPSSLDGRKTQDAMLLRDWPN